jgi:hypothetical protein
VVHVKAYLKNKTKQNRKEKEKKKTQRQTLNDRVMITIEAGW